MILVVIESPYAGDIERNLRYLRACMADCLRRGEAPFASHGLYTQPGVLDDTKPSERRLGIDAGFAWAIRAEKRVVYTDLGISPGMEEGIRHAHELLQKVEYRSLDLARRVLRVFDELEYTPEELDEEMRRRGLEPDEVGERMADVAKRAMEKSPLYTEGYGYPCDCCGKPLLTDEEDRGTCDNCAGFGG